MNFSIISQLVNLPNQKVSFRFPKEQKREKKQNNINGHGAFSPASRVPKTACLADHEQAMGGGRLT